MALCQLSFFRKKQTALTRLSACIIIGHDLHDVNLKPGSVYSHSKNVIFVNCFSLACNRMINKVIKYKRFMYQEYFTDIMHRANNC